MINNRFTRILGRPKPPVSCQNAGNWFSFEKTGKSTVPVGTGDILEKKYKKGKSKKIEIISNPEFLREGEAIRDFRYHDRIVVGSNNKKIFQVLKNLYLPLINKGAKFFTTSRRGAELIKYASNAFWLQRLHLLMK